MKKLKEYYNEKYSIMSVYVIKTILLVFILSLMIFGLSRRFRETVNLVSGVLSTLALGLILAYLFNPLTQFFESRVFVKIDKPQLRRTFAVAMTFVLIVTCIILILLLLLVTVTKSVSNINLSDIWAYVETIESDISGFWETIEKKLAELNINLGTVGAKIATMISSIKNGTTKLLLANIMAFYFLLDSSIGRYFNGILDLFTNIKTREKMQELAKDADRVFSGYIRGQFLDAILVGIMVTIVLLMIGVPYAVVIGLMTGLGNLIPYVGPIVGFGSLILICLTEASLNHLVTGGIVLGIVMAVDGNIINPKLLSNNVAVHPVLIILALIAGGQVGGILGMLMAVPVAAFAKLQFDKYIDLRRAMQLDTKNTEKIDG